MAANGVHLGEFNNRHRPVSDNRFNAARPLLPQGHRRLFTELSIDRTLHGLNVAASPVSHRDSYDISGAADILKNVPVGAVRWDFTPCRETAANATEAVSVESNTSLLAGSQRSPISAARHPRETAGCAGPSLLDVSHVSETASESVKKPRSKHHVVSESDGGEVEVTATRSKRKVALRKNLKSRRGGAGSSRSALSPEYLESPDADSEADVAPLSPLAPTRQEKGSKKSSGAGSSKKRPPPKKS